MDGAVRSGERAAKEVLDGVRRAPSVAPRWPRPGARAGRDGPGRLGGAGPAGTRGCSRSSPRPASRRMAYVAPNGRIYEGTYDNPSRRLDPLARVRVRGRRDAAALVDRHGPGPVAAARRPGRHERRAGPPDPAGQVAAARAAPGPAHRRARRRTPAFPAGSIPNYGAWGPDGSLYVTDYGQPILWRIPPGGGTPQAWLTDPRLDGGEFGTTGHRPAGRPQDAARRPAERGRRRGRQPDHGAAVRRADRRRRQAGPDERAVGERPAGRAGRLRRSRKSGNVYITLLVTNQIAVIGPDGTERERFPRSPAAATTAARSPSTRPRAPASWARG